MQQRLPGISWKDKVRNDDIRKKTGFYRNWKTELKKEDKGGKITEMSPLFPSI